MAVQKKNSTTRTIRSSPSSLYPPYLEMITEAITTMKDRTGSSQPSIAKFIEENYSNHFPSNFRKILSMQLKRFVKSEKFVKVKNSYKISAAEKVKKSVKEKTSPVLKKNAANKAIAKVAVAKKSVEKAKKTKRLSQIKTPEALKNKTTKKVATPAKKKMNSRAPPPPHIHFFAPETIV